VLAIAPSVNTRVNLLHVLEPPHTKSDEQTIDPLEWHLKKREAGVYLDSVAQQLQAAGLKVESVIMEGLPADCVIDYATSNNISLIILSTHGRSGLSGWNVSSVVQKIIQRSFKSILLVRAYKNPNPKFTAIQYNRLFVGLDCSARAEYIIPTAVNLAQSHKAKLILGMVIPKPETLNRFPLSEEDTRVIKHIIERNQRAASRYFEELQKQISLQRVEAHTQIAASENVTASLHDMVEQQEADLVMLVAHGHSGEGRWPYGSIATSFIAYGTTSLMIMQDLSPEEIKQTIAEIAAHESKGH
jgi:nucleotide-binding universal stress UspA family protein